MPRKERCRETFAVLYDLSLLLNNSYSMQDVLEGIFACVNTVIKCEDCLFINSFRGQFLIESFSNNVEIIATQKVNRESLEKIILAKQSYQEEEIIFHNENNQYIDDDSINSIVVIHLQNSNSKTGVIVILLESSYLDLEEQHDFFFFLEMQLKNILQIMDLRKLEKMDQAKKDLTAMLVHDLRSPLGIINWNLETLQEGLEDSLNEQQKKMLSSSINNSKELLEMIDSILDIERLEAGSINVDFSAVELKVVMEDLIERMDILSQQMGLEFILTCPPNFPLVKADNNLLRRILFNLLFNASKYSPPEKPIEISLSASDKEVTVAIRDHGPGVPPEHRAVIFDKFVQVDAKDQGEVKSKGLGLTFCKLAVEAQQGKIWVEEAIGGGSVFKFILPIY